MHYAPISPRHTRTFDMAETLSYVLTWSIVFNQMITLQNFYVNEIYYQSVAKVG